MKFDEVTHNVRKKLHSHRVTKMVRFTNFKDAGGSPELFGRLGVASLREGKQDRVYFGSCRTGRRELISRLRASRGCAHSANLTNLAVISEPRDVRANVSNSMTKEGANPEMLGLNVSTIQVRVQMSSE